ncbi:hypothetical protein PF010_g341 [Phytophthora fragariae]|uniref:Pectate lyase n=1 Tax=Phytophthora fragariae TaxID=53985 RepID=A0A6G0M3X1_9STRA|nr:hypothetical protein PF010_g341 [Phytophthora fragariae]
MQCPTQVKTSTRGRTATSVLERVTLFILLVAKGVEMAEGSNILTTNCSDRCGESTPCIVQAVDGDSDDYSCLQGYANLESATFVLNNGYGADSTKNIDTIGVMELGTATTQMYTMLLSSK